MANIEGVYVECSKRGGFTVSKFTSIRIPTTGETRERINRMKWKHRIKSDQSFVEMAIQNELVRLEETEAATEPEI